MSKLEKAAYISIIVACAIAVYSSISPRLTRHASGGTNRATSESALVGKPLHLAGVQWNQSRTTLVLAITSQCPFCLRSLPLYRKLDKITQNNSQDNSLFVVSPESNQTMAAFLSDEQIKPRQIVNSPLAAIGLNDTPTLLIVDQSGTVRHAFIGQLDEQRERNLMTLLGVVAGKPFRFNPICNC